jgi:arginase family enzyme
MDVRFYFDPVNFDNYRNSGPLNWKYTIGGMIEKNSSAIQPGNLKNVQVAIIGMPINNSALKPEYTTVPDKIRTALYPLAKTETKIGIIDLGNLKPALSLKGNYQALRDIVDYLNELNIVTLILGGSQDLTIGVCETFVHNPLFSLTVIDAFLDTKKGKEVFTAQNFVTRIFNSNPNLFQFNLLGYQSHFVPDEYLSKTIGINEHLRLGLIRENIILAEPVFRNTDVVSLDLSVVKHVEAPGSTNGTTNGLHSEEICQLAKYAGLSERVKVFGLFGIDPEKSDDQTTIQLAAQISWYFAEGIQFRNSGSIIDSENCTTYKVQVSGFDNPLEFLKNKITDQWWMKFDNNGKEPLVFACSKNVYQQASENEIPALWMKYLQKIDEIVK